ncbi:MAG: hypothetical protein A2096_08940 [Spirochaetes bacterium GWF1_41_5]|nr:MAG: hypothetical protein A2096_08940 [Spirochaetes bacterium GWF1_41_5]
MFQHELLFIKKWVQKFSFFSPISFQWGKEIIEKALRELPDRRFLEKIYCTLKWREKLHLFFVSLGFVKLFITYKVIKNCLKDFVRRLLIIYFNRDGRF